MISAEMAPVFVRILHVLVSTAFLMSSRNLPNLVRTSQLRRSYWNSMSKCCYHREQYTSFTNGWSDTGLKSFGIPAFIRMVQDRYYRVTS